MAKRDAKIEAIRLSILLEVQRLKDVRNEADKPFIRGLEKALTILDRVDEELT